MTYGVGSTTRREVLAARALSKHYHAGRGLFSRRVLPLKAVDRVDLSLTEGETLGLVGESGSGKSTLGRLLLKLETPTEGQVIFRGVDITSCSRKMVKVLRRQMQMIFQDPYASLNPRQPVGKAIEEGLVIHRLGVPREREERVKEMLTIVGLRPEHATLYPHELSGGQRQRVCIARALILNPSLVTCDEPLSALDVSIQAQIMNLLLELQDRYKLTYLFISHDLSVVKHLCDRVAVMYKGQIVEMAGTKELFVSPLHPYTALLLHSIPVVHPSSRRARHMGFAYERVDSVAIPQERGCLFHLRCSRVIQRCRSEEPLFYEVSPGHLVRCWCV